MITDLILLTALIFALCLTASIFEVSIYMHKKIRHYHVMKDFHRVLKTHLKKEQ